MYIPCDPPLVLHVTNLLMVSSLEWQFKTMAQCCHLPVHSPSFDLELNPSHICNSIVCYHFAMPACRNIFPYSLFQETKCQKPNGTNGFRGAFAQSWLMALFEAYRNSAWQKSRSHGFMASWNELLNMGRGGGRRWVYTVFLDQSKNSFSVMGTIVVWGT